MKVIYIFSFPIYSFCLSRFTASGRTSAVSHSTTPSPFLNHLLAIHKGWYFDIFLLKLRILFSRNCLDSSVRSASSSKTVKRADLPSPKVRSKKQERVLERVRFYQN